MTTLAFLKENAKTGMTLPELVDVFAEMCSMTVEGESQIFMETGIFDFTGDSKFYFTLTRQFPNGNEEYYQLQMEVIFPVTEKNKHLHGALWDTDVEGDFFRCVRSSRAYHAMKDITPIDVQVYLDET